MNDADALAGVYSPPTMKRVRYGPGTLTALAGEVHACGGTRAFIIASNTLATKTGEIERAKENLGAAFAGAFSDVGQHVPRRSVIAAAAQARAAGADFIVSIGGGSPIDCGKAVAICLAEEVEREEDLDAYRIRFDAASPAPPAFRGRPPGHITVSTTLSAGEFTSGLGVTDESRGAKDLFSHPGLMPAVAILDPELARHTPQWLWASTGIRAVDHCVELFLGARHSPIIDAVAPAALRALHGSLGPAARSSGDVAGRGRCQVAAWMSAYALHNGSLGLSHSIGHQLGGACGVPHGVTSCIMLPAVMAYERPRKAQRMALLAPALGVDTRGMDAEIASQAFVAALRTFIASLGVPTRLSAVGVRPDRFDDLAGHVFEESRGAVPRADIIGLLQDCA